jgi:hypothetical protein
MVVGACQVVRPEDVPAAMTAAASQPAAFPGAAALLSGFDLGGERGLRHGDRLLYGVTLHDGERVARRLLRLEVDRDDQGLDTHLMVVQQQEPARRLVSRPTRPMGLSLLLTDALGNELQRSRIDTFDAHLESSFAAGVLAQQRNDPVPVAVATLQLLEICNLLGSDAILKRLLGEVASVPLDIRLLWRRTLRLEPGFEHARPCTAPAPTGGGPEPEFDLPFDLYLNDSLLVRCSAAIAVPHGPTAAAAGIIRLSAQQAEQPGPRLELELLGAARGARSDFAAHGAAAFLGYDDEGVALAFSPDGRFVAMPGARGVVELRDLRREDPSPAIELRGSIDRTAALHFLDATTLLVARGTAVEVFACDAAVPGVTVAPAVVHAIDGQPGTPVAIEPAGERSVFVGFVGAAVERWTLPDGGGAPQRETVCKETWQTGVDAAGNKFSMAPTPPVGWLLGGRGPDRCRVRWTPMPVDDDNQRPVETLWTRSSNGTWTAAPQPLIAEPKARRQRWDGNGEMLPWDEVAHGLMLSQRRDQTAHGAVAGFIAVTRDAARNLGQAHAATSRYIHGFSPDGAFYACVGPGHRLLVRVAGP